MIVFKKDWSKYPTAIVDLDTQNKTFLYQCKVYKDMGIGHWYFPLALIQPELRGKSPYDPDLDILTMSKMLRETDENPWYYLREVAIDPGAGLDVSEMRFRANRANIAALWLILARIDYIQIQPRQTGKSFGSDCNTLWLLYFKYSKTQLNIITKDETLRKSNVERLKKLRDAWPSFLCRNTKKDENNQMSLSCNALENRLFIHVAQASEKAANNLGRGLTSPHVQIDEPPFFNHIELTVTAAMGATNAARAIADRKGFPYATVMTTTAGNKEDRDGRYVYNLWAEATPWTETFFDCVDRGELKSIILKNGRSLKPMVNLTLNHLQLGLTDEWLMDAIANAKTKDQFIIGKDYLNQWASAGEMSLLSKELAGIIRANEKDPIMNKITNERYMLKMYENLLPNEKYVMGIDTSDAIGRDDIGVVILNLKTGAVAAVACINDTLLSKFSDWLGRFLVEHVNVTLVIENKLNAQHVIDTVSVHLIKNEINPFKRIFNKIAQTGTYKTNSQLNSVVTTPNPWLRDVEENKRSFGFHTNKSLREMLFGENLSEATQNYGKQMKDKQIIHQLLNLEIRNNRVDHKKGEHDDLVVAWLLGHWFLKFGLNMNIYGINPNDVYSQAKVLDFQAMSASERVEHTLDDYYIAKVMQIKQAITETVDRVEIIKLEAQLKAATNKIKNNDSKISMDAMLKEVEEKKENIHRGRYGNKTAALLSNF